MAKVIIELSEAEHQKAGEEIARILGLRKIKGFNPPRYDTTEGNKTAIGLSRTIAHKFNLGY